MGIIISMSILYFFYRSPLKDIVCLLKGIYSHGKQLLAGDFSVDCFFCNFCNYCFIISSRNQQLNSVAARVLA